MSGFGDAIGMIARAQARHKEIEAMRVGDEVWSFKKGAFNDDGTARTREQMKTTILRFENDIVYMADGSSGHKTRVHLWTP